MEITSIRSLADEEAKVPEELEWELDDEESCASWYLATRAAEDFRTQFGYYPGMDDKGAYVEDLEEQTTWILNKMNETAATVKEGF